MYYEGSGFCVETGLEGAKREARPRGDGRTTLGRNDDAGSPVVENLPSGGLSFDPWSGN